VELLAIRLFLTLVIDVERFTSKRMNLSGITPIFCSDRAYTLVLGKPSIIQLWFSFSCCMICFLTNSITMLSSTTSALVSKRAVTVSIVL